MRLKKGIAAGCIGILSIGMMAGCGSVENETGSASDSSVSITTTEKKENTENENTGEISVPDMELDTENMFTERDLDSSYEETEAVTVTLDNENTSASNDSVKTDGQNITISQEGVYVLSGTLSDGQVVVDAEDTAKIQIVLDNCDITSKKSAAIYVKSADKVFITSKDNTENKLANTEGFDSEEKTVDGENGEENNGSDNSSNSENDNSDNINAVVYSKEDVTFNGTGKLNITTESKNGIRGKDDVKLVDTTLTINAEKHAISVNDSIRIHSGAYLLKSSTDGLHVNNTKDGTVGYIYIEGGNTTIESGSDGMDASGMIQIDDGEIKIAAGDDGIHSEAKVIFNGGDTIITKSEEGIEGYDVVINDGDINITAKDDGINATSGNGSGFLEKQGPGERGDFKAAEKNDINTINTEEISAPPEKTENDNASRDFGEKPDKLQNEQEGKNFQKENQGFKELEENKEDQESEEREYTYTGNTNLSINGGVIMITADGDGIDSNGTITVTGGQAFIEGPANGGNGSIDAGDGFEATITGGTIIAAGADGMAENFGEKSTQGSILQSVDSTSGEISLKNKNGDVVVSYLPEKSYSCVLISTPAIKQGETYTLTTGEQETEIEMTDLLYGSGQNPMMSEQRGKNGKKQEKNGGVEEKQ